VSIVLISTSRSKEVPHISKVLIERSLGSLLSYLDLWSRAGTRGIRGSASTSSLLIILGFFIVNIVNLFTGNQGILITSHAMQNLPPPSGNKTLQSELHSSMLTSLQSAPPAVLR